jgi:small GTP-binding protein
MPLVNYGSKEITYKIVYYGCGLGGKTTCLKHIHGQLSPEIRGELVSLSTETERTLFFDYMPVDFGEVNGLKIRLSLYTVPGQAEYDRSRRLILKGVDAIVFVADSAPEKQQENVESLVNMIENLAIHKLKPGDVPWVMQYNKRDLSNALPLEELEALLNSSYQMPAFETVAIDGRGVFSGLKMALKLALAK